ncbi:MAG: L-aspartate oxidase [Eggerthellaceae bacterium]
MNMTCDVVIVGTGVAGLFCALNLPRTLDVLVVTKRSCEESDSFLAQGGVCVLHDDDDFESFFRDTMDAGHGENDPQAVRTMIAQSREVIDDLIACGVRFDRRPDGSLDYTREGAHSRPRILFHKDVTGREVSSVLLKAVRALPNVRIMEHTTMLDLIEGEDGCCGIVACGGRGEAFAVRSRAVVFATGGVGGLYRASTNFPHITGEALAIAHEHGVVLQNLSYVQIHPTALYSPRQGRSFLVSESVRGEGAVLLDKEGRRFVDELLPRDVVSRAIRRQMEADGTDFVWEDLRPLGEQVILDHFPNIRQRCLEEGYDVLRDPIPVTPAQHYFMGGIKVDLQSRTSMPGLYACGEVSCNGVHGKNRLASNSLLESLVFSKRAAHDIAALLGGDACGARPCEGFPEIDLEQYSDPEGLLAEYARIAKELIERDGEVRG